MTVPGYCCRCFSSHSTDSASRWLVGSSRRRMSGCCSNKRHSATRRFSPPEQMPTSVSPGGQRSASMAISSFESRSQAPAASSLSCTLACRSMSLSMSAFGSAKASLISSNSLSRSMTGCTPCSTISFTVFDSSSCGSCSRKPTVWPGERTVSPRKSRSTPARMRSSDDFPDPFRPMTPIFAP